MVIVALEDNQPHPSAQMLWVCQSSIYCGVLPETQSTSSSIRSFISELNSQSVLRSLWAALSGNALVSGKSSASLVFLLHLLGLSIISMPNLEIGKEKTENVGGDEANLKNC